MTAAVTRDITIVYGSLTVGGTSDYLISSPFRLELDARRGLLDFTVTLSKDTEATFLTDEATLLTAFRTDRQRLRITLGASTRYDFNPSSTVNTGFDHVSSIEKLPGEESTGQSAQYKVAITWGFPGTLVNADGHTEATIEFVLTPANLKQLRIAGTYTAVTTNTAYAQYVANADTLAATWTAIFGGTYNKVADSAQPNDTNKTCQFERLYKEVFANEGIGILDLSWVIDQQLAITRVDTGPGDSEPGVRRPQELVVAYDTSIDRTVTTDLVGRWSSTILPHLLNQVRLAASTGSIAAVEVSPVFDVSANRISATLRCMAYTGGLLELEIEVEDQVDEGTIDVPVWDDVPFSRNVYPGPRSHVRTVTTFKLSRGEPGNITVSGVNNNLFGGQGIFALGGGGNKQAHVPNPDHKVVGTFIPRSKLNRKKVVYVGTGNARVKLTAEFEQRVFTRAERPL